MAIYRNTIFCIFLFVSSFIIALEIRVVITLDRCTLNSHIQNYVLRHQSNRATASQPRLRVQILVVYHNSIRVFFSLSACSGLLERDDNVTNRFSLHFRRLGKNQPLQFLCSLLASVVSFPDDELSTDALFSNNCSR